MYVEQPYIIGDVRCVNITSVTHRVEPIQMQLRPRARLRIGLGLFLVSAINRSRRI